METKSNQVWIYLVYVKEESGTVYLGIIASP